MMRRWRYGPIRLPARDLHRGRDQVILEIPTPDVPILIIGEFFIHCRCESLRQATMYLPLDNHGIDDRAAVIYRHETPDMYLSRPPVDVNDTDIATEGKGEVSRVVVVDGLQSRLQEGRAVGIRRKRYLLDGLALAGCSLHEETSGLPFEVIFAYLQKIRGDLPGFVAHFTRRQRRRRASNRGAATAVGPQTIGSSIRITMFDVNVVGRQA